MGADAVASKRVRAWRWVRPPRFIGRKRSSRILAAAWHKLVKRFHGFARNGELLGAPLQRIYRQELHRSTNCRQHARRLEGSARLDQRRIFGYASARTSNSCPLHGITASDAISGRWAPRGAVAAHHPPAAGATCADSIKCDRLGVGAKAINNSL